MHGQKLSQPKSKTRVVRLLLETLKKLLEKLGDCLLIFYLEKRTVDNGEVVVGKDPCQLVFVFTL